MKTLIISIAFLLPLLSSHSVASTPEQKAITIQNVFVPKGQDTTQEIKVAVTGWLFNDCHEKPFIDISFVDDEVYIDITSLKYDKTNPFCPPSRRFFSKVISLGLVPAGEYLLHVNADTPKTKTKIFTIMTAPTKSDDDEILINSIKTNWSERQVTLRGYKTSDCYYISQVVVLHNQNSFTLTPEIRERSGICSKKLKPFKYIAELPVELDSKHVLFHVEAGQNETINKIVKSKWL